MTRLVALGDSITVGVGDAVDGEPPLGVGWAAHLARLVRASSFANLSRNGARARHVVTEQLPRALAVRPDVATLVVGGNDALRSDFSAYEVVGHLSTAVTALTDGGCSVVLARLPAIGLFERMPRRVGRVMRARVAAVNAAVDAVADAAPRTPEPTDATRSPADGRRPRQGAVVVVDLDAVSQDLGRVAWHADRVHPSAEAHRHLAAHAAVALGQAGVVAVPGVRPAVAGRRAAPSPEVVAALAARLPATPPPPSPAERARWLVTAGVPWCVRRGRDFVPGLVRAVLDDARGRREQPSHPSHPELAPSSQKPPCRPARASGAV